MVARHFYVAMQQVIRSVLILLFPLSFITLFTWATAGSTYGSTGDPLRAAVWLWLGAHLTPFNVVSNGVNGYLSFLPIGSLLIISILIRSGYKRALDNLSNQKVTRTYFIISYILIYTLLALSAINTQVKIDWLRGLPTLLVILLISTSTKKIDNLIRLPLYIFLILIGVSGLIFTLSLLINFSTAKNLLIVIQPGVLGGLLLVLLQILYLPNIFFITFSYLIGSGFSFGRDTYISPFIFDLSEIPAIPILAALPKKEFPVVSLFSISIVIVGIIVFNKINKVNLDRKSIIQLRMRFIVSSVIFIGLLAWITSGELLSENMAPIGVNPIIISSVIAANLLLALVIVQLIARISNNKKSKGRL